MFALSPRCSECLFAKRVRGCAGYILCMKGYGWQIKGRTACCEFMKKIGKFR